MASQRSLPPRRHSSSRPWLRAVVIILVGVSVGAGVWWWGWGCIPDAATYHVSVDLLVSPTTGSCPAGDTPPDTTGWQVWTHLDYYQDNEGVWLAGDDTRLTTVDMPQGCLMWGNLQVTEVGG